MKLNYIKTIIITIGMLAGTSCTNYLDVVPSNIAVIEEAFETRDNAERFLATLYGYLPPFASTSNPALTAGDEIAVNDNISRNWQGHILARGGQSKVVPLLGFWGNTNTVRNTFVALRDCNIFLDNIHLPFDLQDYERNRWQAEAKVLKAYFHFYLMRQYGPIPIVRENIEAGEGLDAVRVRRDPVDEVVAYIVELLDEAIASGGLPDRIEDVGAELGRLTVSVAYALKARVLTTAASPLFNGNSDYANFQDENGNPLINTSYDESKWTRAVEACREAIEVADRNGHFLYEFTGGLGDISDTTHIKLSVRGSMSEPWNEEVIWGASNSIISTGFQSWVQPKINPALTAESRESTQSYWSPTLQIAEQFYSNNGVPINEDTEYNYADRYQTSVADTDHRHYIGVGQETANLHFNREPRFYAFLGFDRGIWEGHGQQENESLFVEGKSGERGGRLDAQRWSLTGYWAKKMVHYEAFQSAPSSGFSSEPYPFPVIRLADLYLLYAEALNETGQTTAAYEWIDKVRARAGLNGVVESWQAYSTNPDKPASVEGLREIIHQERLIELAFEGQRFWDLRRWKKAEEYLNAEIKGWNVEGESAETYYNVISYGRYQFSLRDYFWPIAEADILANPNLVQNPGW